MGRLAGSLPGFRFSPAMANAGKRSPVWTPQTLDAFLVEPPRVVPRTEMTTPGIDTGEERRTVVEYLERAGRSPGAGRD